MNLCDSASFFEKVCKLIGHTSRVNLPWIALCLRLLSVDASRWLAFEMETTISKLLESVSVENEDNWTWYLSLLLSPVTNFSIGDIG